MEPIREEELTLVASIDTVSKLLDVPKSTLRYYDDKGIIQSRRRDDKDSAYRIYTRQDILTLFDFLSYRGLDIPVKDIQALNTLPLEIRPSKILELIDGNQKKIQSLIAANNELLRNLTVIQKYLQLIETGYRITETTEIRHIKEYHMLEPEHARQWLNNPFSQCYALIYDCGQASFPVYEGLANTEEFDSPVIWSPSETHGRYLECLTKTRYASPDSADIEKHLAWIREHGLKAGKVLCLFLIPLQDEETSERFDVYHTWIELAD